MAPRRADQPGARTSHHGHAQPPRASRSPGDDLTDGWEGQTGSEPNVFGSDEDGANGGAEQATVTDPADPAGVPTGASNPPPRPRVVTRGIAWVLPS